ncbi:hypothetical protein F383_18672 [Gossypium arboreum]|uniref:Uncharacterized protein n=1 Tax=Gossypium arboreum TaxID=29729 RepID=A0A0B0NL24_GOSAR|nr:hypothetical protein F383_18672 [Gossypium arboreum]
MQAARGDVSMYAYLVKAPPFQQWPNLICVTYVVGVPLLVHVGVVFILGHSVRSVADSVIWGNAISIVSTGTTMAQTLQPR